MAGDIKRQRKSWTLQDRSKVSINILRANLAEEGDEDAQLDMAKRLLQESSDTEAPERSRRENARLALYWLIKSSEQGNDEATLLLKECLRTGSGLTAQNILDVQTCITTPKHEKLTFKAARRLFRKLSNGEEFITTAQLLARMNAKQRSTATCEKSPSIDTLQEEDILEENGKESLEEKLQQNVQTEKDENSINSDSPQTKEAFIKEFANNLNETFIVSTLNNSGRRSSVASRKSTSPTQNPTQSFHDQTEMLLNELPSLDLQFAMIQAGKKLTLGDLLNVAKDFNAGKTPNISVDARSKIQARHTCWSANSFPNVFIAQLLILAVLGNVMHTKLALAYFIFLGVVWSSYNCFLWKLRYKNFEDWRLAFESVLTGNWDTNKLKTRLAVRYMVPHLVIHSVGPLLIPLLTGNQYAIINVSVGIIAICSIQFGLQGRWFPTWQNVLVLCLTLFYYRFPGVSNFFGESIAEQTSLLHEPMFQLHEMFCFSHFRFTVDVYTMLVFTVLLTTVKLSPHKIINETIPNAVLVLWIQKILRTSASVEVSQLVLGILVGLIVCGVMVLLCSHLEMWKIMLIILTCLMLTILTVTSIHPDFLTSKEEIEGDDFQYLEWENYEASCHRKAWNVQSPAATQIKCSSLYGDDTVYVKWKGRISVVKVEKLARSPLDAHGIENVAFDISVGIFPSHKEDGSRNWQNFLSGSSDTDIVAPASVIVSTNDIPDQKQKKDLIDHILNLRTGDRIEFVGKLKGSTAGSLKPQIVDVQSIQCLSCTTADYGVFLIELNDQKNFILDWLKGVIGSIPVQANHTYFLETSKTYLTKFLSHLYSLMS